MKHAHAAPLELPAEPIGIEAFKAEVSAWADGIGVAPAKVPVRGMKRKWAYRFSSRVCLTGEYTISLKQVRYIETARMSDRPWL